MKKENNVLRNIVKSLLIGNFMFLGTYILEYLIGGADEYSKSILELTKIENLFIQLFCFILVGATYIGLEKIFNNVNKVMNKKNNTYKELFKGMFIFFIGIMVIMTIQILVLRFGLDNTITEVMKEIIMGMYCIGLVVFMVIQSGISATKELNKKLIERNLRRINKI